MLKKLFFGITLLLASSCVMPVAAQWECPSQLAGSLKPVGDSRLMWASELTLAGGSLANQPIFNAMGLLGVDYTVNHHTFYLEGGAKYWSRRDNTLNTTFSNAHLGIREVFYQFKNSRHNLSLGVQTMKSADDYLLNERVAGLNYQLKVNNWELQAQGGSVTKDFARNGTFCNVAYIYDILPYRYIHTLGNTLGETNLAMVSLLYHPGSQSDEFAASDDGLSASETALADGMKVETIGATVYSQFGSLVPKTNILAGFYSTIDMGKEWLLKPEILYQSQTDNRAAIVNAQLDKSVTWGNSHRTSAELRYVDVWAVDEGATAQNLFSNIFAGTVLRLDAPDLPFWQVGLKHAIPKSKFHIKLQYTSQLKNDQLKEFDVEIGRKFWNGLRVNATYGHVSGLTIDNAQLFRVEARLSF